MRRLSGFVVSLLSAVSCITEILPPDVESDSVSATSIVTFEPSVAETKSSISPFENAVLDINVYAFRDGMLVAEAYAKFPMAAQLELPAGHSYDI